MYSKSGSKKQRPTSGYLVRPRTGLSKGLYSLRPLLSTSDKRKKTKKSGDEKMEFRKKPDYADTAYREAVSRLRILLAESYTPIKRSFRELDSAGEDTDNQSIISANSRTSKFGSRPYYPYLTSFSRRFNYYPTGSTKASLNVLPSESEKGFGNQPKFSNPNSVPPELLSFIEKQEDYIGQLEKESTFCKEELSSLLSKVKDVISENENLHEKQKYNLMKSVFNHLETETETETEVELNTHKSCLSPKKSKKTRILEGPAIVFESRISELEAQLTQARIDMKKALEENEILKKKVGEGIVDDFSFDSYKRQTDALQREKDVLQDTVSKLQSALTKIRDKENDTCDKVKRSLDVAEQAQYEKNAADLEIRRLKDELERQHSKLRDAIAEQTRRVSDERSAVERRYTQQIEQLTAELGVQWETSNKLQLELDKQRRENTDLRRELAQKNAMLDEMKKDMQNKIISLQSDIGVNGAEKNVLEQQISTLNMTNERNERQWKQEVARLQTEIHSLRQRLDRADADVIHSRRENLRLNEQVASLEKEINLNTALNEERKKKASDEILALPPPKKEQDMSSLIQDMESKHAATVAELEGMIHSQNQLMDKLSVECHTLTQKLDDANSRHKEEIRELQTSLDRLNNRFSQSQITSSSVKDEDYNSISNQRTPQPKSPTVNQKYDPSRDLSRTSSRASIRPSITSSRQNSQEKLESTPPLPYDKPLEDAIPQYQKQVDYTQKYQPDPNGVQADQQRTDLHNNGSFQQYDPNNTNQEYGQYDQQYEGDQQYMTQEEYDQQYAAQLNPNNPSYDPNVAQQYAADQQYSEDPNQQYTTDPSQQYSVDPNFKYSADTNQAYAVDHNQQYTADPSQHFVTDTGQQNTVSDQKVTVDPKTVLPKQYSAEKSKP